DSIPAIVGKAAFQADAAAIAARSIVMVKDSAGVIYGLASARPPVTLVTYAEEENRTVGLALAAELRSQGFGVGLARLWPASGAPRTARVTRLRKRAPAALFATGARPTGGRGPIGLPMALTELIARTARDRPTVLVSLGNPYLISGLPEVGSYLI